MKIPIWAQARTLKELAAYYGVDTRTFKKWIACPTLSGIRPETGRYFSVSQIKIIVKHLGSNEDLPGEFAESQT